MCELGGWPGAETFFRLRMLLRAAVRTKAPALDRFLRVAVSAARTTRSVSKNMSRLTVFMRSMV